MQIRAKSRPCLDVLNSSKEVRLPLYQRPYVWDTAAIKLLDDIRDHLEEARDGQDDGYFVGNILLVAEESAEQDRECVDLVDGQQRLTTLFVTVAYLKEQLKKNPETAKKVPWLQSQLSKEPEPEMVVSRLTAAREGVTGILTEIALKGSLSSKAADKKAVPYATVLEEVKDWTRINIPTAEKQWQFAEYLVKKVYAVVIEYPDTGTALRVFEDINSKGEELLQADLMKSAFMKMCRDEREWDSVDKDWSEIMKNASSRKNGDDGFIRKALLAMVWPAIKSPKDAPRAKELLRNIEKHCAVTKESGQEVLQKIATFSRAHGKFGQDQGQFLDGSSVPALVRLRRIPSTAEFVSTMVCCIPSAVTRPNRERICLAIEAAAALVGLTKTSKNINYVVQPWYVELRSIENSQVDSFTSRFLAAVAQPRLALFKDAFLGMRVGSPQGRASDLKWAKYFLALLEDLLREGLGVQRVSYEAGAKAPVLAAHLEHIIPQSAISQRRVAEDVIYSIGNCTLLEAGKNKSIQDASYAAKLVIYQKSDFRLTNEMCPGSHGTNTCDSRFLNQQNVAAIVNYPVFKEPDVLARAQGMLGLLLEIWGLSNNQANISVAQETEIFGEGFRAPSPEGGQLYLHVSPEPILASGGASGAVSLSEREADVNSYIVLGYRGQTYRVQLLAADIAPSSRTSLNARKGAGKALLGLKAGDTVVDSLFDGPRDTIKVLSVL